LYRDFGGFTVSLRLGRHRVHFENCERLLAEANESSSNIGDNLMPMLKAFLWLLFFENFASGQHLSPRDLEKMPVSSPVMVASYGSDPLQVGELRLPTGRGPFPAAVIIHGGCWSKGFATRTYMSPLATALTAKGIATWNIEYRQLGDKGGGWPGSYQDWAKGTDYLQALAQRFPLDLSRVIVLGHSAGASAALWVASRGKLPATSPIRGGDPLTVLAAVAIDGPGDLAGFIGRDTKICGQPVISNLMGGSPSQVASRYAEGSPLELLPIGVPTVLVASRVSQPEEAEAYRKAATAKGDETEVLMLVDSGHFDMLSPETSSGIVVEDLILRSFDLSKTKTKGKAEVVH
jgi:acetyl esterase/lipase